MLWIVGCVTAIVVGYGLMRPSSWVVDLEQSLAEEYAAQDALDHLWEEFDAQEERECEQDVLDNLESA
jgi:hypothetical protein